MRGLIKSKAQSGWDRGADSALGRGRQEAGPWFFGGAPALTGLYCSLRAKERRCPFSILDHATTQTTQAKLLAADYYRLFLDHYRQSLRALAREVPLASPLPPFELLRQTFGGG
jgi:hypothetical protein